MISLFQPGDVVYVDDDIMDTFANMQVYLNFEDGNEVVTVFNKRQMEGLWLVLSIPMRTETKLIFKHDKMLHLLAPDGTMCYAREKFFNVHVGIRRNVIIDKEESQ